MVNIQEAVINETTVKNDKAQPTSPALPTQVQRDFAPSSKHAERILCCYVNATNLLQIARSANVAAWYFERVVFPGERFFFEALPDAHLEIHTGMMATAILTDKIPCKHLRVTEQ